MCIFSDAYHFYKAADWSDMESYESDDVMQNNNGIIQQEVYSHLHRLPALSASSVQLFSNVPNVWLETLPKQSPFTAITLSVFLYLSLLIWYCFYGFFLISYSELIFFFLPISFFQKWIMATTNCTVLLIVQSFKNHSSQTGNVVKGPRPTLWRWRHRATLCWLTSLLILKCSGLGFQPCTWPSPSLKVDERMKAWFLSTHTSLFLHCSLFCFFSQLSNVTPRWLQTKESSPLPFTPAFIHPPWTASGPSRFAPSPPILPSSHPLPRPFSPSEKRWGSTLGAKLFSSSSIFIYQNAVAAAALHDAARRVWCVCVLCVYVFHPQPVWMHPQLVCFHFYMI